MNFEELETFLKEITMYENYQPVIIRTLLQSLGYRTTRDNIIEKLREENNDENRNYSQILWDVTNEVLNKPERKIVEWNKQTNEYSLNTPASLSDEEEKTLIDLCNYNIKRIRSEKSGGKMQFNCWIWSVTPENWEIVKSKRIWASRIPENIRTRVRPMDKVIFYVQGTGQFQGIYEFNGEWYDAKEPIWTDETDSVIYPSQIKLKPIKLGHLNVYDIAPELKIFSNPEDKRMINLVLKGGAGYPSNNGKPISSEDYLTILGSMTTESGGEISVDLSDLIRKFDGDRKYFKPDRVSEEEREYIRRKFVEDYPLSRISSLSPEDYVMWIRDSETGKYENTFCYRLEKEIPGYGGIRTGTPYKYGVYWKNDANGYEFRREKFQTLEQAFTAVKNEVIDLLKIGHSFTIDKRWKTLSEYFERYDVLSSLVRSRILVIYYPEHFVGIHSVEKIDEILEIFGQTPNASKEWAVKQSEILQLKNSHPVMKNWNNEDFREFVWNVWKRNKEGHEDDQEEEPVQTLNDLPLPVPTNQELKEGYVKISDLLLIPEEKVTEIVTALASGRHVLLAGPIGTGKTELARLIPKIFWEKYGGYYSEDYTATSDWSTQEVIGGIFPKMNQGGNPIYEIQNGCVVETVSKNWKLGTDGGSRVSTQSPSKDPPYRGTWLIIDEFNRADIDKAFGQMFTALRTYTLKIPTDKEGQSYKTLKIPNDYRIIGTLNTQDKHFLFQLSDALKSRFAYIEVDIPKRKELEQEIYYAMKHALHDLQINDFEDVLVFDHQNKKIDKEKSSQEFIARAYQAYNFLDLVRIFKNLGTAILKLVYQNMIAGTKMGIDSKIVLDNALTSNLVPQLENLPYSSIGAIRAMYAGDIVKFFKEAYKSHGRQSYADAFSKITSYLQLQNSQRLASEFANGTLQVDNDSIWQPIQTSQENKKKELEQELSQLTQSIEVLIKSMAV